MLYAADFTVLVTEASYNVESTMYTLNETKYFYAAVPFAIASLVHFGLVIICSNKFAHVSDLWYFKVPIDTRTRDYLSK